MKKIVFTLALLLMSLSAALAQTWNFADRDPFIGDADETLINADATNWYNDATKGRYNFLAALDNAALTANGTELNFAKGLLFKCGAAVASSNGTPANQSGKIRLNYKSEYLELNGSNLVVTIPNVQKDWVVTVVCKTASKNERGLYASANVGGTTGFGTPSKSLTTCTGTVTETGNVTLTTTDGGMLIYSISVKDPNAVIPEPVDPDASNKVNNAVSRDTYKNQMFVTTTSGSVNYYNTEDLSKVTFEGDKTIVVPVNSGAENDEYAATVKEISFAKKAEQGQDGIIENPTGAVKILEAKGWQESAYLKWEALDGAASYNVYVDGKKIDAQLVRKYTNYYRADALGLKAGNYSMKVVPVNAAGEEIEASANTASDLSVKNYDRAGFAHFNYDQPGVGAYNNDGTLKSGAKVLYITAKTAKTVSADIVLDAGKAPTKVTGFQAILDAYQKGNDPTPIVFRIIGTVRLSDLDKISSSSEGIQVKGKSGYDEMRLTFEGVGDDATVHGFGFLIRNAKGIEFRNFAIMNCLDDGLSLDTKNQHIWIHNMDMFYGQAGGDSDQAKGDGTIDLKGNSQYITIAYNRFWDSGKSSLCGMKSETNENWITYHHNWFDHSDSRHPRIRTMSVHVYNNYYDGNAKYGVGATTGSSAFVESNYFRNAKDPMMSSGQGTDAKGDGTFSGETGGMIKEYGNIFAEKTSKFQYVPYSVNSTSFDCYDVKNREDKVPTDVKTVKGGTSYNNFDTDASKMYAYTPDAAIDVPAKVTGFYGAGRLNHGDLQWSFDNSKDDDSYAVNSGLKNAVVNYKNTDLLEIGGNGNSTGDNTGGSTGGGETGDSGSGSGSGEGGSTGGSTGGSEGGSTVTPIEGTVTCSFTANGKEAVPSNSAFTLTGENKNVKAEETVIEGTTYSASLKMESKTEVSFTTSQKMTLYVYYGTSAKNKNVLVDGTEQTGDPTKVVLEAGAHKIAKDGSSAIALIKLVPVTE